MDQATTSVSSPRNGDEAGLEQLSSDLQALKKLYGLLHKGPADENLDEASRALLMKMLDDATQQTLLKQAKILSGSLMSPALERILSIRSDRQTRDAEPPMSLRPPASPSPPSLLAGERPSRLNPQYSTVLSRAGGHVHGGPLAAVAAEDPILARLASYRSSRTTASALPPRHRRPSGEQRNSGFSLYRLPVAATSRHGTVMGSDRNADQRERTRRTSRRGDQTSLEASSSGGSERARRGVAAASQYGTVSRSMRRRRRQEILAKRVERLRMLKNKIATVFHHHYHYGRDQEGPSSSRIPGEQHHISPWKYLGGMLHHPKGQDKKPTSRAVASAPGKRPGGGGGGNMHALFDAMRLHLRDKRRAPASDKMWRKIANRSRVQAKKMHWWQRLKPRRGRARVLAGSKLRRRLGR
ncbi:hypothetical protein C2845_PM15G20860 [Panicum miliaceum]|uniref:Uncharacterized protein n=1 Tax=Panicum miliaceum TaxID=4540 RepID=A0A3L6Q9K5_PANMI|nr:hypothetical protein C2845_PM15G20860 [Panicum miliaceum]